MEWIKGEVIGRGSFGTVNLATLTNPSNTTQKQLSVVVKSSHISNSSSLKKEKEVLTKLGNRNRHIIQYLGDSVSEEKGTQMYNLFLEYASKGSLADHLRKSEGKFGNNINLRVIKKYIRGILSGLCHVHENGFVHCDVKLQNVLVFDNYEDEDEDEDDYEVKVADFGLARRVDDQDRQLSGTPLYMSPEIVGGKVVTTAVDIWAMGCAVVEMVSGFPAWDVSPENDVSGLFYRIGVKGECPRIPKSLCDDGKDFLDKCFKKDPSERWTARMLLEHTFLSGCLSEKWDVSPKCPFEFPDWESSSEGSGFGLGSVESFGSVSFNDGFEFSSLQSVSCRFDEGVVSNVVPDWSDSDEWITIR